VCAKTCKIGRMLFTNMLEFSFQMTLQMQPPNLQTSYGAVGKQAYSMPEAKAALQAFLVTLLVIRYRINVSPILLTDIQTSTINSHNYEVLSLATKLTMADTSVDVFFRGSTGKNTRSFLRLTILCLIAAAAVSSRLFSVIRTYTSHYQELVVSAAD
jgi:hypothetical protein